ncbi:MAG: porin family protein [Prevotella sp.]
MRRFLISIITAVIAATAVNAQDRQVQNKPYIDLRPLHFGIRVGLHAQDIDFQNVGPQTIIHEDGTETTQTILCDADSWNPGLSVGVVADLRLSDHLSFRFTPTMHFGSKHLVFRNITQPQEDGTPTEKTQEMKQTILSLPLDLKFSAKRYGNYRPYMIAGISPMINFTKQNEEIIQLKRYDTFIEAGIGCDLYLPFFKIIPELKFCYSLSNSLNKDHTKDLKDGTLVPYSNSVTAGHSKMIVLTFYFE